MLPSPAIKNARLLEYCVSEKTKFRRVLLPHLQAYAAVHSLDGLALIEKRNSLFAYLARQPEKPYPTDDESIRNFLRFLRLNYKLSRLTLSHGDYRLKRIEYGEEMHKLCLKFDDHPELQRAMLIMFEESVNSSSFKAIRKTKPVDKKDYERIKQEGRLAFKENYAHYKKWVNFLKEHFPWCDKFSRQNIYVQDNAVGEPLIIDLPASVRLDPSKPDGFVVLDKKLGQGNFGRVKSTWHCNESVVLPKEVRKIFPYTQKNINLVASEADFLRRVDDFLPVVSVWKSRRKIDFSQRYMPGVELRRLDLTALTFFDMLRIMKFSIENLSFIHSKEIIHHDVKLENLIVKFDNLNSVKAANFIDFGLSKNKGDKVSYRGTVIYASPDLFCPENFKTGEWIDHYSLAGLFSELLFRDELAFREKYDECRKNKLNKIKQRKCVTRVHYSFEKEHFRKCVSEEYRNALIVLLEHMADQVLNKTLTDDQIHVFLRVIYLNYSLKRGRKVSVDFDELVAGFEHNPKTKLLNDEFNELTKNLKKSVTVVQPVCEREMPSTVKELQSSLSAGFFGESSGSVDDGLDLPAGPVSHV